MRALAAGVVAAALAAVAVTAAVPRAGAVSSSCRIPAHPIGWEAVFGYRSTQRAAYTLQDKVVSVGFKHAEVERVGCPRWAVALHGLKDRAQARELAAEAKRAGFTATPKCWPLLDLDSAWEAVFGTGLTQRAATRIQRRARGLGFSGLKVLHDPCANTWLVELDGIPTLKQARMFRAEATRAGFTVRLRQH
jgi:hypothetical protein